MQITMGFNAVYAPDHRIESCIWFYEDTMEATPPWVQNYAGKADISTLFSAF